MFREGGEGLGPDHKRGGAPEPAPNLSESPGCQAAHESPRRNLVHCFLPASPPSEAAHGVSSLSTAVDLLY